MGLFRVSSGRISWAAPLAVAIGVFDNRRGDIRTQNVIQELMRQLYRWLSRRIVAQSQ